MTADCPQRGRCVAATPAHTPPARKPAEDTSQGLFGLGPSHLISDPPEKNHITCPGYCFLDWPVFGHTPRKIMYTFKICHLTRIHSPTPRHRMLVSNRE